MSWIWDIGSRIFGGAPQAATSTETAGAKPQPQPLSEIGATGLRRQGTNRAVIFEESDLRLRGAEGAKKFKEMRDNSAIVGAGLAAIETLIRQVSRHVEPYSQQGGADKDDEFRANRINGALDDMSTSWTQTLGENLSMLPFGWALAEVVLKVCGGDVNDPTRRSKFSDGLYMPRKIAPRGQDTLLDWQLDDSGGVQGMRQSAAPDYKPRLIPIERALLFRPRGDKSNPEGRSILRSAFTSWDFAKKLMVAQATGVSRDLTGIPIGWLPAKCFQEGRNENEAAAYNAFRDMVTLAERDELTGALIPLEYTAGGNKLYDLTLLTTGGQRSYNVEEMIQRYELRIAMAMLADFLLIGHGATGSFALSSDRTEFFAMAIGGYLDSLYEVYNSYLIPRLVRVNGWPIDRCPTLRHGKIAAPNLSQIGDYMAKIRQTGIDWSKDTNIDAHLRRIAGLPEAVADALAKGLVGPDGKPISSAMLADPKPNEMDKAA